MSDFDPGLALFTFLCILLVFVLAFLSVIFIEKRSDRRGVMIQSIFRSNFILLGLPLVSAICGGKGDGLTSMMIAIVIPLFNILAIITLEIFRDTKATIRQIILKIIKNPLIVAIFLGLIVKILRLSLNKVPPLTSAISSLAQIATPLLLFILGASFQISSISENKYRILFCVLGRLICAPAIAFFLGIVIGLRGISLVVLLSVFASPTATNSYRMAQQMGGDADLASGIIVISTIVSCFTMVAWIVLLRRFSFI